MKRILFLATLLSASIGAAAQDNITEGNVAIPDRAIVLTGGQNGINSQVMTVLYDTSEMHFQDPVPPRFLLIDREGRTVFGIGGFVEGIAEYDFDGALDNVGFVTRDITVPNSPDQRNRLDADLTRSNIFMQLVTRTRFGILSAYVKGNFSGDGGAFKLKQAYVRLHNVLGGLSRSAFQDVLCGVPTIDYQGPSGAVSAKNIQIRYTKAFNNGISFALSAELPRPDFTTAEGLNEKIAIRTPDIPAYVQYAWDNGHSHVRASGLFRSLSYRNLLTAENRFATGWAVELSGAVRCTDIATLYYQAAYGKGYAQYLNDLSKAGYDLIYDGQSGKMTAPGALGIVGGVRFNLTKNIFISGTYSLCRLYDQQPLGETAYRRADYIVANCFYTPIRDLQVGVEYLHGRLTDMSRAHGTANRLEAMVKYSF